MLAPEDHTDIETAADLVNKVIERHRVKDLTLPAMAAFCAALQDLRLGKKYLEAS